MRKLLLLIVPLLTLSSCKYFFPNYLFRETKDFYYYEMTELKQQEHVVMHGDFITFNVTPQNGLQLIDWATGAGGGAQLQMMMQGGRAQYFVRHDGTVDLPILGEVQVAGMKRLEVEKMLKEKYASVFVDPFLIVSVSNRRAFVFAGLGRAQVVPLPRENTSLAELLALSGGIAENAKSNKIRVIRGDYENPTIKKVDLSTINGLKDAGMIIQANDLVVIEPVTRAAPAILREISPYLGLLTTALTLVLLFRRNN
jgi:polysaccharide export outer membrane protein